MLINLFNIFEIALSAQGGDPRFYKQKLLEQSQKSLAKTNAKSQYMFENAEDLVQSALGNIDQYIKNFKTTRRNISRIVANADKFIENNQILHDFAFDFKNDATLKKMIVEKEVARPFFVTAFKQELSNIHLQLINYNCFMEFIKRFILKFKEHEKVIQYDPVDLLAKLYRAFYKLEEDTKKLNEKMTQTKKSKIAFNLICSTNNPDVLQK